MPGGQSAQTVQQIEGLLAQLAQEQPQPQVQAAIKQLLTQLEPLQALVGASDEQGMQSGLANPAGAGALGGAGGAMPPEPGGPGAPEPGGEPEPGGGGEGTHHVLEIHIGAGGPKDFAGARKAAAANYAEKGHFGKGAEEPTTAKSRRASGK